MHSMTERFSLFLDIVFNMVVLTICFAYYLWLGVYAWMRRVLVGRRFNRRVLKFFAQNNGKNGVLTLPNGDMVKLTLVQSRECTPPSMDSMEVRVRIDGISGHTCSFTFTFCASLRRNFTWLGRHIQQSLDDKRSRCVTG